MFGDIPVERLKVTVPKASAARLEKDRRLVVEGNYVHWDEPERIIHHIPNGAESFEFDFKDESDSDSLPDADGYISQSAPLDGRIYYRFYIEYHNSTDTRIERVSVEPEKVNAAHHSG
jgi:hypothetical protein